MVPVIKPIFILLFLLLCVYTIVLEESFEFSFLEITSIQEKPEPTPPIDHEYSSNQLHAKSAGIFHSKSCICYTSK